MIAEFYKSIDREYDYFACTVAGGAMPLGYSAYCCKCNPANLTMTLLKKNLVENLNITYIQYIHKSVDRYICW